MQHIGESCLLKEHVFLFRTHLSLYLCSAKPYGICNVLFRNKAATAFVVGSEGMKCDLLTIHRSISGA